MGLMFSFVRANMDMQAADMIKLGADLDLNASKTQWKQRNAVLTLCCTYRRAVGSRNGGHSGGLVY